MATNISGSTGIDKIQDGVISAADISSSVNLGKVLQVVAVNGRNSDFNTTSTSNVLLTDSSITITPTSTTSRVYVTWQISTHQNSTGRAALSAYRGSTDLGIIFATRNWASTGYIDKTTQTSCFDHPNTTAAVTYSLYAKVDNGSSFYAHRTWLNNGDPRMRIVAMEIEADTSWS